MLGFCVQLWGYSGHIAILEKERKLLFSILRYSVRKWKLLYSILGVM